MITRSKDSKALKRQINYKETESGDSAAETDSEFDIVEIETDSEYESETDDNLVEITEK